MKNVMFLDNKWVAILFFIILSIIVRFVTFFHSSYDWDESLYILGALELLNGNLPYLTVWDHKPPGIFLLFAAALNLTESIIFPIRILSCIFVGASAYAIFILLKGNDKNKWLMGFIGGLLYIFSSLKNGGLAANSELFYTTFILYSFILAIKFAAINRGKRQDWNEFSLIFFAGFLLGLAGLINYLALLYCGALGIFVIICILKSSTKNNVILFTLQLTRAAIIGASGPIIIFSIIITLYFISGSLDEFIFANYTANHQYITSEHQPFDLNIFLSSFGSQLGANWLLWLCVFLAPFMRSKVSLDNDEKQILILSICWLGASFLAIFISRLYWPHYFLQFNPALCIIAAMVIYKILCPSLKQAVMLPIFGVLLILVGGFYTQIRDITKETLSIVKHIYINDEQYWGDDIAIISQYIKDRIISGQSIYIVDYNPIIYALSGAELPTRYLMPPHLIGSRTSKIIDVDPNDEVKNILELQPVYIIKKRLRPEPEGTIDSVYELINTRLMEEYEVEKSYAIGSSPIMYIDLYRNKSLDRE